MIQRINLVLSSLALVGIIFVLSGKSAGSDKVAYIDVRKLVENYKEFKPVTLQYQKKLQDWQARINTLNAEFEAEIKQFEAEEKNLSLEEKSKRSQELAGKQRSIQKYQQNAQQQMKIEDDDAMKSLIEEINNFLKEYGEVHKYQLILAANGENLAYADKALDITEEVIEALNKK